jgi:cytochrome c-type protein NapC
VEYRNTIHYQNRTGVRATCPDCHVPKEWTHKMIRKIQAATKCCTKCWAPSTRLRSSTPSAPNWPARVGPHEEDRQPGVPQLPQLQYMDYAEQNKRSSATHQAAFTAGKTCIDCHKGIAHRLPEIEQNIGAPKQQP